MYDGAGEFLRFAFDNIKPSVGNWADYGTLQAVSTKSYKTASTKGVDDSMFLYLPNNCKKGGCRAQIMLHGCIESYRKASKLWAERSGFLEYAASNDIVVVFPQTNWPEKAYCWDLQGWTGSGFTTKNEGVQTKAIFAMMADLKK